MNHGRMRLGVAFMAVLGMIAAALGLWRPLPSEPSGVPAETPVPSTSPGADDAPREPGAAAVKRRPGAAPVEPATPAPSASSRSDDADDTGAKVTIDDARGQVEQFVTQLEARKELLDQRYDAAIKMLEHAGVPDDRIDAVEAVAAEMNAELAVAQKDFLAELLVTRGVPNDALGRYRRDQALLEAQYSAQIVEVLGDDADRVPSAALDAGRYLDVVVPDLSEIPGYGG